MQIKPIRNLLVALGVGALIAMTVSFKADNGVAANLTGGQTTYVINGEEATFPTDPVKINGGTLVPLELFAQLGVTASGTQTKNITLKKADVSAKVTLGSPTYELNGAIIATPAAPVRLNGRLFVPVEMMKEFGFDVVQDGSYLVVRTFTPSAGPVQLTDTDFQALKAGRTLNVSVKADSNIYLNGEFTLLTPELLNTTNIGLAYGARSKLLTYVQTNTVLLVKLSNNAFKSGGVVTANFALVDQSRTEYDVTSVLDIGSGLLSAKLAPGADRMGALVFPKVLGTGPVTLYFDSNGGTLGTLNP